MVSPAVLAAYTFFAVWLVLKYRLLLKGKPQPIVIADVSIAVVVAAAVVVIPSVPIHETAWCADVGIDPVSAVSLVLAVIGPVFDEYFLWPAVGMVSAVLTAMFLARSECYGVASIVTTAAICAGILRVNRWYAA